MHLLRRLRMFFKADYKNSRRAITMAELLITLAIIGVLACVFLPVLSNALPSKEESIHQKMTYVLEQVIAQMIDDDIMYEKKSDLFLQGFQNTEKSIVNGVAYEGDTKFCQIFASKFNKLSSNVVCENGKKSFTTTDNVDWYLPVSDFKDGSAEIMIDVNGEKEGQNCLKGAAGCKNPDRFKYYIKPNGTIALEQPNDVINDTFKIVVNVTNPEGGTYAIAPLFENGSVGTFQSGSQHFMNLPRNTRYIIKATPSYGYFTDWAMNQRRVIIVNSDVKVHLIFHKRSTYCVTINVENCDKTSLKSCADYEIKTQCKYEDVGAGNGDYALEDGIFQFVGLAGGGQYKYKCVGETKNMALGKPKFDPTTGEVTGIVTGGNALHTCDLMTGDYQLIVKPKAGYTISTGEDYIQDIRLGTDHLTFGVALRQ